LAIPRLHLRISVLGIEAAFNALQLEALQGGKVTIQSFVYQLVIPFSDFAISH
jgi:hypothetical protein